MQWLQNYKSNILNGKNHEIYFNALRAMSSDEKWAQGCLELSESSILHKIIN